MASDEKSLVCELLLVTTYRATDVSAKKCEYSEFAQLQQGLNRFGNAQLKDLDANIPLMSYVAAYSFTNHLIDNSKVAVNNFGMKFLADSRALGSDLLLIMQYFENTAEQIGKTSDPYLTPLNPFRYSRFANSIVDLFSTLPAGSLDGESIMKRICWTVLFRAEHFCQRRDFLELKKELFSLLKSKGTCQEDIDCFDHVFDRAFKAGIAVDDVLIDDNVKDILRSQVSRSIRTRMKSAMFDGYNAFFASTNNMLMFNTAVHQYVPVVGTERWIRNKDECETEGEWRSVIDMARRQLMFVSMMIGNHYSSNIIGNSLIAVILAGYEQGGMDELAKTLQVTVRYRKKKYRLAFIDGRAEIVIPVEAEAEGSVYVHEVYDGKKTRVWKGKLAAKMVKKQKTVGINHVKFDLHFNLAFFESCACVTGAHDQIPPNADVNAVIDYVFHMLVENWLLSMEIMPAPEWYMQAVDLALRYSISAPKFFSLLSSKMLVAFNKSRSYIDTLATVILSLSTAMKICMTTRADRDGYNKIMSELKQKVFDLLQYQLSKPDLFEHTSITSLVILLAVTSPNGGAEVEFSRIMSASLEHIVTSAVKCVKFEEGDTVSSHDVMEIYAMTRRSKDMNIPLLKPIVVVESLLEAVDHMCVRIASITCFYTKASLPDFADAHADIFEDFSEKAHLLARVFSCHDPPPPEPLIYRFLASYRRVWNMTGAVPKHSPCGLFESVILQWLTSFGGASSAAVEKAVTEDNFELVIERRRTSSSCRDVIGYLNNGLKFLEGLHSENEDLGVKVMAYVSLCVSALRLYADIIISALYYSLPNIAGKRRKCCSFSDREMTPAQMFVAVNNLVSIRTDWTDFTARFARYNVDMGLWPDISVYFRKDIWIVTRLMARKCGDSIYMKITDAICDMTMKTLVQDGTVRDDAVARANAACPSIHDLMNMWFSDMSANLSSVRQARTCMDFLGAIENGLLDALKVFRKQYHPNKFTGVCLCLREIISDASDLCRDVLEQRDLEWCFATYGTMPMAGLVSWLTDKLEMPLAELQGIVIEGPDNASNTYKAKNYLLQLLIMQRTRSFFNRSSPSAFSFCNEFGADL